MSRVIITGGRSIGYPTKEQVMLLNSYRIAIPITVVLSGCCRGIDEYAICWAKVHQVPVLKYPAPWYTFGRSASCIRNKQMADNADALVLFPGEKETALMRKIAEDKGLPIYEIT